MKQVREAAGESQEALADIIGCSRQTIISIEKGRWMPSLRMALRIARHYKTTVEEVFHNDDNPTTEGA